MAGVAGRMNSAELGTGNVVNFTMFEDGYNAIQGKHLEQSMEHIWHKSPVTNLFFSNRNKELLHGAIRYRVWVETERRYVIAKQSDIELSIIMRGILLMYGKNVNCNIVSQVKELNTRVIEFAVPRIVTRLSEFLKYRMDISTARIPMEHSASTSVKGTKILELKNFF